MGGENGVQLVRELRRRGFSGRAVVMTSAPFRGLNEAAREAGAQGTILKSGVPGELLAALRRVVSGKESIDPRHPRREGLTLPTARERDILRLVARGATNREAAVQIGVAPETAKALLARTYAKLGVRGRAEAVAVAQKLGLL